MKKKYNLKILNEDDIAKIEYKIKKEKEENQILIDKYIKSLNEFEIQAMNIANKMLETSFDIEKSIGFLKFKTEYENNKT